MSMAAHQCDGGLIEVNGVEYACPHCREEQRPHLTLAHARTSDPITSHEAAASFDAVKLSALQLFVHWCLQDRGPSTDEELVAYVHENYPDRAMADSSIRSRRNELVHKGKARPVVGTFRDTSAGHRSQVWEAV